MCVCVCVEYGVCVCTRVLRSELVTSPNLPCYVSAENCCQFYIKHSYSLPFAPVNIQSSLAGYLSIGPPFQVPWLPRLPLLVLLWSRVPPPFLLVVSQDSKLHGTAGTCSFSESAHVSDVVCISVRIVSGSLWIVHSR